MRTLHSWAAFAFVTLLILAPVVAAGNPPATRAEAVVEFVDPSSPEVVAWRATAETAINWLGAKMVHEVNTALARDGAEPTVAIAHLKSISSGGQVLPGMPRVTAFKSTSLRLLNAANAPDAAEQLALERIARDIRLGNASNNTILQRITAPDGSVELRAYRPLVVMPSCLACHGDPAAQSPRLRTLLREHAPGNEAVDYAVGDWRGVLRVTVTPRK